MKRNPSYMLRMIDDVPYILPVGQSIADHRHGIRLNESGLFLWNALAEFSDEEELTAHFAEYCKASEDEFPMLRQDVHTFLLQLSTLGILHTGKINIPDSFDGYFQIGGILIGYHGPLELLSPAFSDFAHEAGQPELTIRILPSLPAFHANGTILIRTREITICKNDTSYLFLYPDSCGVRECHLSLDGSHADFFCPRPFSKELSEELFHAIRFAYLVKAQQKGLFAVHSASLLYHDRVWLFSGPSGSGKSTHTNLWHSLFDVPLVNGDLNLIGYKNDTPVVYGLPWCGTSGIYTTSTYPLGGIVFLKKAPKNTALPFHSDEAQLLCAQRMISPSWTMDQSSANLDFAAKLWKDIPMLSFACTKEESAAHAARQLIDQSTNDTSEDLPCTKQ